MNLDSNAPLIPKPSLYKKFGDPHRLVEFRVFSFNNCSAGCKNCFYKKSNNNYWDFAAVDRLAFELESHGYSLETLYLLPTDVFENEFNYRVFKDPEFLKVQERFSYIGLATALNKDFDRNFLENFFSTFPDKRIELHVNIKEDLLFQKDYLNKLQSDIRSIKALFGERILLNLALNLGSKIHADEMKIISELTSNYSDDGILELNFTFLFNDSIPKAKKRELLLASYPVIQHFSKLFDENERAYNTRTLLRKPSFVFKDRKIFLSPIIPFDEYAFLDDPLFQLKSADFDSFLETMTQLDKINIPILKACESCELLSLCQGKHFFSAAQSLGLNCIKLDPNSQKQENTGAYSWPQT